MVVDVLVVLDVAVTVAVGQVIVSLTQLSVEEPLELRIVVLEEEQFTTTTVSAPTIMADITTIIMNVTTPKITAGDRALAGRLLVFIEYPRLSKAYIN